MNALNHLGKVVKRLKSHELQSLYAYLDTFRMPQLDGRAKSTNLVRLLADDKQPNEAEVLQFKLYGKPNAPAFERLVRRTREKVLESLLFYGNLNKPTAHSDRNRIGYELRKRLIETEILASRGLTEDNETIYEYMLNNALTFEFYDIVLEILYTKHTFSSFTYGIKKIQKIKTQIEKYEKIRDKVNRARIIFDQYAAKINFAASPDDYIQELPSVVERLKENFVATKSATIGYYLYLLETEYFQQLRQFEKSNESLIQLIELLEKSPSVHTKNRMGTAFINLAGNEMIRMRFESGLEHADKAAEYFKDTTVNLNVVREAQFKLHLFSHHFEEAESIIANLYESSAKQKTSFLFYKRTYLYACLKSIQGDPKRSEELLAEVREIEKDKEGWNIGIRLLQIMNLIDRGKSDVVESQVVNLKKYLLRLKGQRQALKRYSVILRILTRLMNDNYRFGVTFRRSGKYFDLLQSADDAYAWSVNGPEIVAFHEWFVSRMELRRFSFRRLFGQTAPNA